MLGGLLAAISFASAFQYGRDSEAQLSNSSLSQQFYNKYCNPFTYNNESAVQCSQFIVNETDIEFFQKETLPISDATYVFLRACTIQFFNENFINKFPKAANLNVDQCTLYWKYVPSNISKENTVLQNLTIQGSTINNQNVNAAALSQLTALRVLTITGSQVESSTIDGMAFANNTNLVYLEISDVPISEIYTSAFANNRNLETIKITGTELRVLPHGLFRRNEKLQTVILSDNKIVNLPLPFFPTSVVDIELSGNALEVISAHTFKDLKNLSSLDLSRNNISVLSNTSFAAAKNLTFLNLHTNQITKFERKLFSENKYLKTLFLYNNKFTTLPEDTFDDLDKLEIVIIALHWNLLEIIISWNKIWLLSDIEILIFYRDFLKNVIL